MLYWNDTKSGEVLCFFIVFLLTNEKFIRYTQVLWKTLCINCYIQLLTAVFITVLLDCTKTRQSNIYIHYQLLTINNEVFILRMKATPSH